jgi:hypothetical protein
MTVLAHQAREDALRGAFASAQGVAELLGDVEVPTDIAGWLGRLHALSGVPFGYLVPDEAMLPPESIRFFHVDTSWAEALVDGAFSVGRNLTADASATSLMLDVALAPAVLASARAAAPRRIRAATGGGRAGGASTGGASTGGASTARGGAAPDPAKPLVWTGFLLRSRVVTDYPGLGVNAYPAGATGDDPAQALTIVRFERLGPAADTLICIVEGEAAFFDIHEPPEHLHFGLDTYSPPGATPGSPDATKGLRTFTQQGDGSVALDPPSHARQVGSAFRARSPRVMNVAAMAALAAGYINHTVDAAQFGFEMTEGVGKVRFERATS